MDVADQLPLRTAHLTDDGTALVWDAATAFELRGKHRMLSRSLGMGSIRVSAVQRVRRKTERKEKEGTRERRREETIFVLEKGVSVLRILKHPYLPPFPPVPF